MSADLEPRPGVEPVAAYKGLLQAVMNNRPSGTRHRLAAAIGKNRSFVSQIINPVYPTPVLAQYLQTIFSICHFSPAEREAFLGCLSPRASGPPGSRRAGAPAAPPRSRISATPPATAPLTSCSPIWRGASPS